MGAGEAAHGEGGQAGKMPAQQRQQEYDHVNLGKLVGLLSVTDSQRIIQKDAETAAAASSTRTGLEQRARAEEWFIRMEVASCTRARTHTHTYLQRFTPAHTHEATHAKAHKTLTQACARASV